MVDKIELIPKEKPGITRNILVVGVDKRRVHDVRVVFSQIIQDDIEPVEREHRRLINFNISSIVVVPEYSWLNRYAKIEIENASLRVLAVELTDRTGIMFYADLIKFLHQCTPVRPILMIVPNRSWVTPSDVYCDDDVTSELEYLTCKHGHINLVTFSYRLHLSPFQRERIKKLLTDVIIWDPADVPAKFNSDL